MRKPKEIPDKDKLREQVAALPLEVFRHPKNGRKWRSQARQRQAILWRMAKTGNPDGTFTKVVDGKLVNYSPSEKRLCRHFERSSLYRRQNEMRDIHLLDWTRENYERRVYVMTLPTEKQVQDSLEKQVSDSNPTPTENQVSDSLKANVSDSKLEQVPDSKKPTCQSDTCSGESDTYPKDHSDDDDDFNPIYTPESVKCSSRFLQFMDGRILTRGKRVKNPGAYLKVAVPKFLANIDRELQRYLTEYAHGAILDLKQRNADGFFTPAQCRDRIRKRLVAVCDHFEFPFDHRPIDQATQGAVTQLQLEDVNLGFFLAEF